MIEASVEERMVRNQDILNSIDNREDRNLIARSMISADATIVPSNISGADIASARSERFTEPASKMQQRL